MGLFSNFKKITFYRPSSLFIAVLTAALIAYILFSFSFLFLNKNIISYPTPEQKKTNTIGQDNFTKDTLPTPTLVPSLEQKIWGIAEQIDETTWTMNVAEDEKMATPEEIKIALNDYRNKKGVGELAWSEELTKLAISRAETFLSIRKLDGHAGFKAYVEEEENMEKLGFIGMGENSSYGFRLEGVHLIEWIFAGDPPHENNQLDPSWTHVGIGVKGTAVDVIFGKK